MIKASKARSIVAEAHHQQLILSGGYDRVDRLKDIIADAIPQAAEMGRTHILVDVMGYFSDVGRKKEDVLVLCKEVLKWVEEHEYDYDWGGKLRISWKEETK